MDDATLREWVIDARARTLALYRDLDDVQIAVPYLRIINPPVWELGHVAWFQEYWVLRHALGGPAMHDGADALWNSAVIPHAARWTAPLPSRASTLEYLAAVRDRVLDAIARGVDAKLRYFITLSVFHEDMHDEAFAYTRQTMGWPALHEEPAAEPVRGDVAIAGGTFRIGAERVVGDGPQRSVPMFVFDNEKWAHDVALAAFSIARAPVTHREFAA